MAILMYCAPSWASPPRLRRIWSQGDEYSRNSAISCHIPTYRGTTGITKFIPVYHGHIISKTNLEKLFRYHTCLTSVHDQWRAATGSHTKRQRKDCCGPKYPSTSDPAQRRVSPWSQPRPAGFHSCNVQPFGSQDHHWSSFIIYRHAGFDFHVHT